MHLRLRQIKVAADETIYHDIIDCLTQQDDVS
jgi:hypothetical protein